MLESFRKLNAKYFNFLIKDYSFTLVKLERPKGLYYYSIADYQRGSFIIHLSYDHLDGYFNVELRNRKGDDAEEDVCLLLKKKDPSFNSNLLRPTSKKLDFLRKSLKLASGYEGEDDLRGYAVQTIVDEKDLGIIMRRYAIAMKKHCKDILKVYNPKISKKPAAK